MQVILKQHVNHLGEPGDIITVKPGYGRNFLIPRGLAIPASAGSLAEVEHQKGVAEAIRRKQMTGLQQLAAKLEGAAVSIRREAGEDNKLFGSVTNRDIADVLAAEGIEVDRRTISLDEPIRSLGLFQVQVRLHREVQATVKVYVIRN